MYVLRNNPTTIHVKSAKIIDIVLWNNLASSKIHSKYNDLLPSNDENKKSSDVVVGLG